MPLLPQTHGGVPPVAAHAGKPCRHASPTPLGGIHGRGG